jgi:hypothetical protein
MTDALEERDGRWGGFVDGPALEDYAARYADHFVIQRNEGVVTVNSFGRGTPSTPSGRVSTRTADHTYPLD